MGMQAMRHIVLKEIPWLDQLTTIAHNKRPHHLATATVANLRAIQATICKLYRCDPLGPPKAQNYTMTRSHGR